MRVLHVNNEKTWQGGERQTLLTAQEQRRRGMDSQIACRRGSLLEEIARAEGIPTVGLPNALPAAVPPLLRAARSFDLLHCHTGRAHSMAVLATLLGRKPIVVTRRVDLLPRASSFNRWKYRRVDTVVCASKWIAKVLQDWGVPPEGMEVIYEAVPDDPRLPREVCRHQLWERTGITGDKKIIGNIAALVEHKDHATLLSAAKQVVERRRDAAVVIVGEGRLKDRLLRLRSDLGLTGAVHFIGFVPQAHRLLPGFDLLTLSSRTEGLGTIVLDAGLAGVPVVATAAGGLREAVLDGQTGLLAPVANAGALAASLLRLLDDPALAERLARAARRRTETEFTVADMTTRYVEIYESLLAGSRQARPTGHGSGRIRES
jgi:glycosyltransferase involved in cell wall biosynthesis